MGSSAARVAGKLYKEVEIAGKKYRLSQPKLVGVYADIEAFILSRKEDPLVLAARACKIAPPAQHDAIWRAAMLTASQARIVTEEEYRQFAQSKWSVAFSLWKALDPQHHEEIPTVEAAMDLILAKAEQEGTAGELAANVAVVQQDVDLKNSSGPTATADRAQNQATENHSTVDGQPSTTTSPSDSAGPIAT